ncbi:MAG: DoxX family membrane protein [Verrucomicrobiales bacterium]|nr:DoxX family membrane protein [Verrucomicrobiales bacterium]
MSVLSQPDTASPSAFKQLSPSDLWIFLIRFFTGYPMIHYQAWKHARTGWDYMWQKTNWTVHDQMVNLGASSPGPMAVLLIFFLLTSSFGIVIGFLTRINSILLLVCLGVVLIAPVELSTTLTSQTLLLYLGLCLTLIVAGGGFFSLDTLLTSRRRKRKDRAAPSRFA